MVHVRRHRHTLFLEADQKQNRIIYLSIVYFSPLLLSPVYESMTFPENPLTRTHRQGAKK